MINNDQFKNDKTYKLNLNILMNELIPSTTILKNCPDTLSTSITPD